MGTAHKGTVRCLNGTTISLPIIESKFEANKYLTYHTYVTTEVESRPFTRTELQQIRFCTKRRKGCILQILLMGKGSWYSNVNLRRNEGSKKGILENSHLFEDLEQSLDIARGATHPLLAWIIALWRQAFPILDITQFKAEGQWKNIKEAIELSRNLVIL